MKIIIDTELIGDEVITKYFIPSLSKRMGISATKEFVKVMVQNKSGEFVEVDPSKVKFVWKN